MGSTLSRPARITTALVASFGMLFLAACSGDSDEAKSSESPKSEKPAESEETEAVVAEGQPDWANEVQGEGDLISTMEIGDVKVEVFQVGVEKATKTGQFADPKTSKPIIAIGDEVVFVNYVVTNTGDAIDLGSSLVNVSARYDDWPYMQGMDSVVDKDLFAKQGLNDDAFTNTAYRDPSVYTFAKGDRYSFGENFPYQAGSPITFDAVITPVDDKGDLLHDKRAEGESTGTVK